MRRTRATEFPELDLGLQLFERRPRGVSRTSVGVELAQTVEASLGVIEEAAAGIKRFEREITLQFLPSRARNWLTQRLLEFSKRYPSTQLSIMAKAEVLTHPLHHNEIAVRQFGVFGD